MREFVQRYQDAIEETIKYTSNVRLINSFRIGVEEVNKITGMLESPRDFLGKLMEVLKSKMPYGISARVALYKKEENKHFVEIEVTDLYNKTPHFYTVEVNGNQIGNIKALSDFII